MLPPLLHAHKHIAAESAAAALRIRAGCDEGESRTRPYLDQHHSPFAIRDSHQYVGIHKRTLGEIRWL
jgi:hypothetical protein